MIHIVDKISSTNDWLSKYYLDIDDTVIALEQTSGKGRRGNAWDSKRGGFYMSTVSSNHKLLPTVVAVSLMRVLSENITDLSLKWPNDLLIGAEKVGGILCEKFGNCSVVGIGINLVNETSINNSTNLISHGYRFDKSILLASFLYNFDQVSALESEKIIEEFTNSDCLIGKKIYWGNHSGIAKSIDLDGSLIVESGGENLNLYSEEVHIEKY